jgi:hypothetical protein
VQTLHNSQGTGTIDVERIKSFFTKSAADQYQETEWAMVNTDPPPIQPDASDNPAHEKKHVVRYFKDNDTSQLSWVDVEQIDQLNAILPQDQYQEYQLYILNADKGDPVQNSGVSYDVTVGFCDSSLDMAPKEDGFDPPYRIDPLQNIVNFSEASVIMVCWRYSWISHGGSVPAPPCGTQGPSTITPAPGAGTVCGFTTSSTFLDIGTPLGPGQGGTVSATLAIAERGPPLLGPEIDNPHLSLPTPSTSPHTIAYPDYTYYHSPTWGPTGAEFSGVSSVSGHANLWDSHQLGNLPAFYAAGLPLPNDGLWATGYTTPGGASATEDTGKQVTCNLNASSMTYMPSTGDVRSYESFATYLLFPGQSGVGNINTEVTTAFFYFTAWFKVQGTPTPDISTYAVTF